MVAFLAFLITLEQSAIFNQLHYLTAKTVFASLTTYYINTQKSVVFTVLNVLGLTSFEHGEVPYKDQIIRSLLHALGTRSRCGRETYVLGVSFHIVVDRNLPILFEVDNR